MHARKHWSSCDGLHRLSVCVLSIQFVSDNFNLLRIPKSLAELIDQYFLKADLLKRYLLPSFFASAA